MNEMCFYENDPGRIIKKIKSDDPKTLVMNTPKGAYSIRSSASPRTHYIRNGAAVEYPEKPNYPCYFDFQNGVWVISESKCWAELREKRDRLLSESDWTQIPDAPVDKDAWAEYRQKLRDLPQNTTDPNNLTWPEKPQ